MTASRNLANYTDIVAIIDTALAQGGGIYSPPDGNGVKWRARAYAYRNLLRQSSGVTRYDRMFLQLSDDKKEVKITFPEPRLGELRRLDGAKLDPTLREPQDDLVDFVKGLGE